MSDMEFETRLIEYIREHIDTWGHSPSYRNIKEKFGCTMYRTQTTILKLVAEKRLRQYGYGNKISLEVL